MLAAAAAAPPAATAPLRVCFLTYRGNPSCGGQGIYTSHLTRALAELGHAVEVWSGPPYPELAPAVRLRRIPSLDLWKDAPPMRRPQWSELRDSVNLLEWGRTATGVFAEPLTFTRRVERLFRQPAIASAFDVVHDNQSLGAGLLRLRRRLPVLATVHHPITVDRDLALAAATNGLKRWGVERFYAFIPEQRRVLGQLDGVMTVSSASADGLAAEFGLPLHGLRVVPNGVDLVQFRPLPEVRRRAERLVCTISAHAPLKGLPVLLDALAELRRLRPGLHLTVIGQGGHAATEKQIRALHLDDAVRFTGRLTMDEMIREYAEASIAVVPSLYEGFGLPAIEAMACCVPVVSSAAGALPEVVGEDGTAGLLVPPGDSHALATAIATLLDDPQRREAMGVAGRARVASLFTWERAARLVTESYREALDRRRPSC